VGAGCASVAIVCPAPTNVITRTLGGGHWLRTAQPFCKRTANRFSFLLKG